MMYSVPHERYAELDVMCKTGPDSRMPNRLSCLCDSVDGSFY